jgi:TRAP-type C4-dicarboxylate transport system permease large subunit
MIIIFVFLVIVGMFMDATAAIYILVPVLFPVITSVGIDPIYFVVFLVITLSFGLITPPVGVCLYAASNVTGLRIEPIVKASIPWIMLIGALIIGLIFCPWIITGPVQMIF